MAHMTWPDKDTFMSDPALIINEFNTSALKYAYSLPQLIISIYLSNIR